MAMNGGKIEFGIGYKVDQSSLKTVESQFRSLSHMLPQDFLKIRPELGDVKTAEKKLQELTSAARELREAYSSAFDDKTGLYNIEKIKTNLKGMDIGAMYNKMAQFGEAGLKTFRQMTDQVSQVNLRFRETNGFLDKMGETLVNTVKWSIASSAVNRFSGAIQQAWGYVQHLDTSLNDIRIVTGKSADEMDRFASKANNAAKALGSSTTEYTEAALIYYQQGLSDEESQARAETTLKAANVTGQTGQQVSEELTAVWNGYKVTAEETELYVDKLAAVAASTASDLEELSTGMSKVASAANNMGVDVDQLNAQLATIVSVTRQAPETAGTALKTIFARIEDLKLGGTDEDGVKLGQVSSGLESMGIEIKDAQGNLRDLGEVIEEIGGKWNTWTESQKSAIAQLVAGKRQYNNLLALFDNWDMYNDALETSRNSVGTLQEQQDIYMESTEAHLQQLSTQWEDMYDSVLDTDTINDALDGFTGILNVLTHIIDSLGGGKTLLLGLVAAATRIKPIANAITKEISNIMIKSQNAKRNAGEWSEYISSVRANLAETMPLYAEREALLKKMEEQSHLMTLEEKQQTVEEIKRLERLSDEVKLGKQKLEDQKAYIQETAKIMSNTGSADETKAQAEKINNNENFTDDREGRKAATDVLEAQATNIDEAEGKLREYIKGIKEVKTEFNKAIETSNNNDIIDPETEKKLIQQTDKLKASKEELKELLKTAGPGAKEDIEALIKKIDEVPESLKGITGIQDDIDAFFEDIEESGSETFNRVKEANQQAMDSIVAAEAAAAKEAAEAAAAKEAEEEAEIRERAQAITDITSGVSGLVFSMQSLINIGSIISDDELSKFEKFSQILTAGLISLPMFTEAIKSLTGGLQKLTKTKSTYAAVSSIASKVVKTLNTDVKMLSISLTGAQKAFLGLSVAAAVIGGIVLAYKNAQKAIREANEDIIESENEKQEAINKNKELIDSYLVLYESYKETGKGADELKSSAEELTKALGIQSEYVNSLKQDYEGLTEEIKNAKIASQQEGLDSAKKEVTAAEGNVLDTATNGLLNTEHDNALDIQIDLGADIFEENRPMDILEANLSDTNAWTDKVGYGYDIMTNYDVESVVELYDALVTTEEELRNAGEQTSDVYEGIHNWTSQMKDDIEVYKAALDDVQKYATELSGLQIDSSKIIDVDSLETARKEMMDKIKEETGIEDEKELEIITDQWLSEHLDKQAKQYFDEYKAIINTFNTYEHQVEGLSREKVQEFITSMVEDNTYKYSQYFTEDDWKNILGANSIEEAQVFIQEAISKHTQEIKKSLQDSVDGSIESVNSVINAVSEGKLDFSNIAEDESFINIKNSMDDLLNVFPELREEAQIFLTEGMVGSEEWAEAAYKIQDAYDSLKFDALNEDFDNALDRLEKSFTKEIKYGEKGQYEITIVPDTTEFVDTIEDILGADYEISVKVYADGIEEFERLDKGLDSLDTMAEKIDENFIVAADDIRELNNTFPGILEGMTYLTDGTIQLNEEVAKSAMEQATKEELSSTNTTATKLENTAKELRAKADTYDEMAKLAKDAAKDAANGEIKIQDGKQKILAKFDEIETKNDKKVSDAENQNSKNVADNSATDAEVMASNWTQAYQEAADATNSWAELATRANAAVASGATSWDKSNKGDYAVNTSNFRTSQSQSNTTKADIQKSNDSESMINLANDFKNMASSYRQQANDLEGAAKQIRAKSLGSAKTNAEAGSVKDDSSSSSSSEEEAETVEYLERETDLYREINEELDDIESTLSRIQKINDHSWGLSAKKSLEQENELLNEQNELLEKKAETYKSDLATRRKALEDQGVTFSDDGSTMTNAEERLTTLYNEYNSMVDKYNAMSAADQENYKSTLEAKKATIENIENAMDDYESAYNDYNGVLDEILDNHYELIENAVNQFNADIDIKLELDDAKEQWEDFWAEIMEDVEDTDFFAKFNQNIRKLDIYTGVTSGANTSEIAALTQHVMDTNSEVGKQIASADNGGADSIFKDDSALSKETLTKYRDNLIDAVKAANDAINEMSENYLNELEKAKDLIDDQIKGLNSVNDHIEHTINVIKMISGEKAYGQIQKQLQNQYDNNLKIIEANKKAVDFYANQMEQNKKAMESAQGTKDYETFKKAYETSVEEYRNAVKDLDLSIEEGLELAQKIAEESLKITMSDLDKKMFGGVGYDKVKSQWDLIIQEQDYYLDNVERALEMESLQFDFSDVLKDMDLRGEKQQEFLKFMDEENAKLKEKNKLTQYDIDEVKARLEIKKAEMALEDAQRNKSNMRLRRDTQGNYTYQYTANEDAIEDAEKGLMSAKKEWWELVKQRNKETANEVLNIQKQLYDAIDDYKAASNAKDKEAMAEAKERMEQLQNMLDERYAESDKAKRDMYTNAETFFEGVDATRLDMWNTNLEEMIDSWDNGGEDSLIGAVDAGIKKIDEAIDDYKARAEADFKAAGRSSKDYTGEIDKTKAALDKLVMSEEELDNALSKVNNNLKEMAPKLSEAVKGFDNLKTAASKAIEEANKSLEKLAETAIKSVEEIKAAVEAAQTAPSLAGSGSNKPEQEANDSTYDPTANIEPTLSKKEVSPTANGTYNYKLTFSDGTTHLTKRYHGGGQDGDDPFLTGKLKIGDLKEIATRFKSGGYTGDWNQGISGTDNGRLAVLHQKELVLNEADTANLLKAVSLIRTLVGVASSADFNRIANNVVGSSNISAQLGSHVSSGALQSIASNVTNNSNVSNSKDITINADFSGVRSADEIYQAFIELQNYGMQESYSTAPHANRSY